jgi:hypothetical protein
MAAWATVAASRIAVAALLLEAVAVWAGPIGSAAEISRGPVAETGMHSEAAPEDTTARVRTAAAAAAPPALDREAEEVSGAAAAAAGKHDSHPGEE